jgi:hypothetical protein
VVLNITSFGSRPCMKFSKNALINTVRLGIRKEHTRSGFSLVS